MPLRTTIAESFFPARRRPIITNLDATPASDTFALVVSMIAIMDDAILPTRVYLYFAVKSELPFTQGNSKGGLVRSLFLASTGIVPQAKVALRFQKRIHDI